MIESTSQDSVEILMETRAMMKTSMLRRTGNE